MYLVIPILTTAMALLPLQSSLAEPDNRGACSATEVEEARERFNRAIAEDDFNSIAAILAEGVVLVTSTDSDTYVGRDRQVALWKSDVGAANRVRYVRTPTGISVSPSHPLAMETGTWKGFAQDGGAKEGEYAAKWRCVSGAWKLEAEIFMTTHCSETLCD